jgi:hypothetical protein
LDDNGSGDLVISEDNNCFRELNAQLRSIFVVAFFRNITEIGIPIVFNFLNRRKKSKHYQKLKDSKNDEHKLLARIELSMDKSDYSFGDIDGTYWDYLELMTQSGYLLLFGLAFPPCFILALANNIIEYKSILSIYLSIIEHQVDKAKIVYYKRRPKLLGGDSIGIWRVILYFLAGMGVLTHAGIL